MTRLQHDAGALAKKTPAGFSTTTANSSARDAGPRLLLAGVSEISLEGAQGDLQRDVVRENNPASAVPAGRPDLQQVWRSRLKKLCPRSAAVRRPPAAIPAFDPMQAYVANGVWGDSDAKSAVERDRTPAITGPSAASSSSRPHAVLTAPRAVGWLDGYSELSIHALAQCSLERMIVFCDGGTIVEFTQPALIYVFGGNGPLVDSTAERWGSACGDWPSLYDNDGAPGLRLYPVESSYVLVAERCARLLPSVAGFSGTAMLIRREILQGDRDGTTVASSTRDDSPIKSRRRRGGSEPRGLYAP